MTHATPVGYRLDRPRFAHERVMDTPAGNPEHVLVVEDDLRYRRSLAVTLEAAGYRVSAPGDPIAVLQIIETEHVDLLLLDIRMPAGTPNGVTIGRMARNRRSRLPIAYITGAYDPALLSAIEPDVPVLTKPFTASELISLVEGILSKD